MARGARRAIQSQGNRRRARGGRILTPVPLAHFRVGLGLQLRLHPAKRLAQIHRHVGVRLTQHAIAAKADHVRHFRQIHLRARTRRLRIHYRRAGGHRPLELPAVIRRIRQLNRQVAKVTGRYPSRSGGGIRRHGLTRTLGIDQRTAGAIDGRDPGAIASQRAEVLRQPEHSVLTRQRDHPIHLHTVGRIGRPLVDNAFRAQHIRATQQIKTITHHRVSRRALGQTGTA